MDDETALAKLKALDLSDKEGAHLSADAILIEALLAAGFDRTVAYYEKISREFWYA